MNDFPKLKSFYKRTEWAIETKYFHHNATKIRNLMPALFGYTLEIFAAIMDYQYRCTGVYAVGTGKTLYESKPCNISLSTQEIVADILQEMQGDFLAGELKALDAEWKELDTFIRPLYFLVWVKNWCTNNEYNFPQNVNAILEELQAKQCKHDEENTSHIPQEIVLQYEECISRETKVNKKRLGVLIGAAQGKDNQQLVDEFYPRSGKGNISGYIKEAKNIAHELGLPPLDEYMPEARKNRKS